jgi:hypothetical protein
MKSLLVLAAIGLPLCAQVKITEGTDRVTVDIDGKPFAALYAGANAPKPYLHPLRTATGKIVTRGYPMEMIEGETRDHPHHRGLWFTHGDLNGFDFWANEASSPNQGKLGKVVTKKIGPVNSGGEKGSIKAVFEWQDPQGKPLLREDRTMVFYSDPKVRTIDFDVTFTALDQVKFGDTKEGFFAIRLAEPLKEQKGGHMVSAGGKTGEKEVWGKRSPWVDYYGQLDGETVGITIMDHPANPKHPTYWHSRAYGLFAANIFGEHDFYNDKSRDGGMTVERGKSLRFRYRVLIHPGDTQAAGIAALYKQYSGTN